MPSWPSSIDSDAGYVPTESPHTDEDWLINYQEQHYEDVRGQFPNLEQLRLQEVVEPPYEQHVVRHAYEQPENQVQVVQPPTEQEVESYPVCCQCGYGVEVVVRADGENIGRRIQICQFWPNGCNYAEWLDDPLCPRGITYANELEQEIRRLRLSLQELQFNRHV